MTAADYVGSTEFIIKTLDAAPSGSAWAIGTELNEEYWSCSVGYCEMAQNEAGAPTLFDLAPLMPTDAEEEAEPAESIDSAPQAEAVA